MFIQVRDVSGNEKFIEEDHLESGITSGEIVAFRRSAGWIMAPKKSHRNMQEPAEYSYSGQERRRKKLSKLIMFPETDVK